MPTRSRPAQSAGAHPRPPDESDQPDEQGYTVQQATRMTGLSEHTLRYYERAGLLHQRHLEYLDRKIAYWQAIESGDTRGAAAIAERFFHSLRHS